MPHVHSLFSILSRTNFLFSFPLNLGNKIPKMEEARVTEIKVRVDCNGCVQKIKKALHGINGINDIYIDVPQQNLTIIGCADPERIVKAIRKIRKLAIIFSESQPSPLDGCATPSDPSNPPPTDTAPEPNEPENSPLEPEPEPEPTLGQEPISTHSIPRQSPQIYGSKEAEEVHVVHHYPHDLDHRHNHERVSVDHYSTSPQSVHVKNSYNTYKPTPYVTDHKYIRSPPQYTQYSRPEPPQQFTHYNTPEPPAQQTHCIRPERPQQYYTHYNRSEPPPQQTHYTRPPGPLPQQTDYTRPEPPQHYSEPESTYFYTNYGRPELPPHYTNYSGEYRNSSNGNGNITSIFSDENPNACTIS